MRQKGWIGVDLDGTLARYEGWKGVGHIGEPIKPIMDRVKLLLQNSDYDVKIFTARVANPAQADEARAYIEHWLQANGLPVLEVVFAKDFAMVELWDDRCVAVEHNTGRFLNPSSVIR